MSETPPTDDRTEDELSQEISRADWNLGHIADTSYGVTATFRKHYTSFFPGVETRNVTGTDVADAMRKFLAELDAAGA
jgi:hypothetical protein